MSDLQRTPEWHASRRGLPSASNANRMLTPTGKASSQYVGYAHELAADMWINASSNDFSGTVWTERGTALEPQARAAYELARDVDVIECGVIVADGGYCASPDGLIGEDGVLEIKCQKHAGHIASIMHVHRTGKPPPEYANQIRMQMLVTGRSYGDFVGYHPDLPMVVARLERDAAIEATLIAQIEATIAERNAALDVLSALGERPVREAA